MLPPHLDSCRNIPQTIQRKMKRLKAFKQSSLELFRILKPASRCEKIVFLSLLLYFAAIAISFCIVALPKNNPFGMLGYDTAGHLEYEPIMISCKNMLNWNLRHPLYRLFFFPIIMINEGLLSAGINISWFLFLGTSTLMMSCCGLFIFKTLQSLKLSIKESSLLLFLFCSFAHVILLCIQVDSFVMSMFFCSAMTLLYVSHFHNRLSDSFLFLGITGTTSTNFVKFTFYLLLEEKNTKKTLLRFLKAIIAFCLFFILTVPNLVKRLIERPRGFRYAFMGDSFDFQGSDINNWKLFIENFISEPLLFHHTTGIIYSYESINLPAYTSLGYYLPIAIIFHLILFSVILNCRKPIIRFFCCCFGFDWLMHFCIGYGIEEGQLFCGHWIFFIPIVIGELFANLKAIREPLYAVLATCATIMLITNLFHFSLSL